MHQLPALPQHSCKPFCTVCFNLIENGIESYGAARLARVLEQCASLTHLDLQDNQIGDAGAESLAEFLTQCTALTHLDLSDNLIHEAGAECLAGVLGQCTVLASLHLDVNSIPDVSKRRLRDSWRGQPDRLCL